MASRRSPSSAARRLIVLLVTMALVPSALLVWFGIRLLEQDRDLVAQRDFVRRQAAAPAIAAGLEHAVADAERKLNAGEAIPGSVRIELTSRTSSVHPAGAAAWLPIGALLPEAPDAPFEKVEAVEQRNPTGALREYEELSRSADAGVRAGALLRVARVARGIGRVNQSLAAYRALSRIDRVAVLGTPGDLQGRRWAIDAMRQLGRTDDAVKEADLLERDLLAGRWSLDGGSWGLVAGTIREVTGRTVQETEGRRLISELADVLARERAERAIFSSRRLIESGQTKAVAIISSTEQRTLALVANEPMVTAWVQSVVDSVAPTGASIRLLTSSGALWTGKSTGGSSSTVTVTQAESGLPWTIAIDSGDTSDLQAAFSGRRTILAWGMVLVVAVLAVTTFLVWRAVKREVAIARLQTDFVAAVSHEFRTPLTSLRHVTELLEESDDLAPERRAAFYRTLGRNTERLHRLVEALLDVSRMETGRKPYALRPTDVSALTSQVVDEFRQDVGDARAAITFQNGGPSTARADAASLGTAIWNLLDNALKYSAHNASIDVAVSSRPDGQIAVSVADKGLGIPLQERDAIFGKFVRGADAGRLGIKGTGLGLALVSHIVAAHDGRVELESTVGVGSTFTILIPAHGLSPKG